MERKAVHVVSVRPLIVNLKAIKRTELLTEHNSPENFFGLYFASGLIAITTVMITSQFRTTLKFLIRNRFP